MASWLIVLGLSSVCHATVARQPHAHATHTHASRAHATRAHCGADCGVEIPSYSQSVVRKTPIVRPTFQRHGLIQIQAPTKFTTHAPATVASLPKFAVASPQRGKVIEKTEPTYFCKKPGFVLEGEDCVSTVFETPRMVCPGGFDIYGDVQCLRKASFLKTCPTGYNKRDGNCVKVITANFLEICPEGTAQSENSRVCHRQVAHPLTPTCPEGTYDGRSGNCIVNTFVEARAYCPEGFQFDERDGVCLQEEIYDCTNHLHPSHGAFDAVGHPHHRRVTRGRELTVSRQAQPCQPQTCVEQPCVAQRVACEQPKVLVQPTKTTINVQKTCTRVTSTALVFDCDEGLLQGQRCLVKQSLPAVPECRAEGSAEYCYSLQRVPPVQECPVDFEKECLPGKPCQCVAIDAIAYMTSCPGGFSTTENGCERLAEAQAICPTGFVLQDDTCVRVLREPADCVFSVTYECDRRVNGNCIV